MHADPILPLLVTTTLIILLMGLALRRLRQPQVVAYLLAGIVLGPHGLALFTNLEAISRMGDLGIVLLLFFVGMEMSLPRLASNWKVAVIGTTLQILLSLAAAWGLGAVFDWPAGRVLLIGFVISLSSTAVVVAILKDWGALDTELGRDAMGILIVQDLALVPMLIVLATFSSDGHAAGNAWLQVVGGLGVVLFGAFLLRQKSLKLPFSRRLEGDHELQVFASLGLCLGFALVTSLLGLSAALGAFLAGIVVASTRDTEWVARSLDPIRTIFLALFFVSIGLLIDLDFLRENAMIVGLIVAGVFLTNTFANAAIVRIFGRTWRHSLLVGALLSQAGDFSFVMAAIGAEAGLISQYGYQMTVSVIAATIMLSPLWVAPFRRFAAQAPTSANE